LLQLLLKELKKDLKSLSGVSKSQVGELMVAVDKKKSSSWTQNYYVVVIVSFLLKVAIRC